MFWAQRICSIAHFQFTNSLLFALITFTLKFSPLVYQVARSFFLSFSPTHSRMGCPCFRLTIGSSQALLSLSLTADHAGTEAAAPFSENRLHSEGWCCCMNQEGSVVGCNTILYGSTSLESREGKPFPSSSVSMEFSLGFVPSVSWGTVAETPQYGDPKRDSRCSGGKFSSTVRPSGMGCFRKIPLLGHASASESRLQSEVPDASS